MLKGNEKILIVKPSSLGDIVHSLAFLHVIKENFPSIQVHWVVAKGFEDLLIEHPLVEKVIIVDKDKWKRIKNLSHTVKEFSSLKTLLKKEKYDITIDLQGLLRSGLITWFSNSPIKVGFREGREFSPFFYNTVVSASIEQHAVLRYLEIARALGCKINSVKFPLPEDKEPHWLRDYNDYIVVIPNARWQSKNWPIPYFVELVKRLDSHFLIVGSKGDKEVAKKIEEYSEGKATSVAGMTSLRELIAVFKKGTFVITPDTGTMHLAVASGKRVVAIFGPTSHLRTGPFGEGHLVIRSDLSCSPCFKKNCVEHFCMREITPERVYNSISEWRKT